MREKKHLFQKLIALLLAVILTAGLAPPAYMEGEPVWEEDFVLEETEPEGSEEAPELAGLDGTEEGSEAPEEADTAESTVPEPADAEEPESPESAEPEEELQAPESAEAEEELRAPESGEAEELLPSTDGETQAPEEVPFEEPVIEEEGEEIVEEEVLEEVVEEKPAENGDILAELAADVKASILDAFYNAFELGLLPAVRRQSPYGDCWAFAGIGGMEADLIADSSADTSIDLSEYYVAYFASHLYPYAKTGGEGDSAAYTGSGSFLDNGGISSLVFRLLANLIGTVREEDVPYPDGGTDPAPPTRYAPTAAQITGAYLIDVNDRDAVKQAILDHGAVSADINMVQVTTSYPGGYVASFRENGDKSCLYGNYAAVSHEVLLVGWDDEFAVSNFSEDIQPPEPGAWLARNSWGYDGYGANGYFWISYYDASLQKNKTTAYDATSTDFSDFCYSYDKVPFPASRYVWSETSQVTVQQSFPVDGHEILQAVGVETASDNVTLTVSVRRDGEEIGAAMLSARYEGFYRIPLETPYELSEAADIELSVTYTAQEGDALRVPFAPERTQVYGQIEYTNVSGEGGFWCNNRFYNGDSHLKLYTKKSTMAYEVETVSLSDEALSMLNGETTALTAYLDPVAPANPEIRWTSSDPRVVRVNAEGKLTAGKAEGTAVITAMTSRGVYATCTVENRYRDFTVLRAKNVEFDGLIHLLVRYDLTGIREENWSRLYIAFYREGELLGKCAMSDYYETVTEEQADGTHLYAHYSCPVQIAYYLDTINIRAEDSAGDEIATVDKYGAVIEGGYDYSLDTYAENMIDHGSAVMKRMAQALKDYGIALLLYIGHDTGGQTVSQAVADLDVNTIDINETVITGQAPEGVIARQTVVFDSDNALLVAFWLPEGKTAADYIFRQDGETVEPTAETDPVTGLQQVTLRIPDISPDMLNTRHDFSISDEDSSLNYSTSALGYAKRKASNGSAGMKILAKALCNYYVEALRYINARQAQ